MLYGRLTEPLPRRKKVKKRFVLIVFVLFTLCLYAQNSNFLNGYQFSYGGEFWLEIKDNKILEHNYHDGKEIEGFSYEINENGFVEFTDASDKNYVKKFFLLSSSITYVVQDAFHQPVLGDSQLISINSSGYFSEKINGKLVEYKAENLRSAVIWGGREDPFWYYDWNEPFVTKRDNSGIGEYIDLSFVNPQKSISILGGFVRTTRQDLFRKNNRLKKVLIKDLDSDYSVIMNFEDIAMFQGIAFEKYLKNIRIEILEVYKGTQYDDTCISGIMISNFYPLKE